LVDWIGVVIAFLAAAAAVILNILPLGECAAEHLDLFRRWTDLREDVDAVLFDLKDNPDQELIDRLKSLDAKMHRICGAEPMEPDKKLLRRCYDEEVISREGPKEAACA
jgi:hypothetical protein